MKIIFGILYVIASFALVGYLFLFWGLINPIINIAEMIDANAITATGIAWEVIKILLREFVTGIVVFILYSVGVLFLISK